MKKGRPSALLLYVSNNNQQRLYSRCSLLKKSPHLQVCHRPFTRLVVRGSKSVSGSDAKSDGVESVSSIDSEREKSGRESARESEREVSARESEEESDDDDDESETRISPFLSPSFDEDTVINEALLGLELTTENVEKALDDVRPMLQADG